MALMLRYLGIPARVAAGFTSGVYDKEREQWSVYDRNAHTWVEVWFDGFGWLPFDPTPGRGTLAGPYSTSSARFDLSGAEGCSSQAPSGETCYFAASRKGGADAEQPAERAGAAEARGERDEEVVRASLGSWSSPVSWPRSSSCWSSLAFGAGGT